MSAAAQPGSEPTSLRADMRRLFPSPGDVEPVEAYGRLSRTAAGRPAVRLNMIASVDGAASSDGRSGALGGPADKALFATLRSLADVIVVGAGTVRAERYGPVRLSPAERARPGSWGLPAVPPIAVITRTCRLDWDSPLFRDAEERPLVVTTSSADATDRQQAAEMADVVVAGDLDVDFAGALSMLGERGHADVLCEGGPGIAAQLAAGGLIDEVCLTVAPLLVGGDAGRILHAPTPPPESTELILSHILESDGYLFLRYRRLDDGALRGSG